jgi:hypothetical protein
MGAQSAATVADGLPAPPQGVPSFNRAAFEAYLAEHSPLKPAQIDAMFGAVDASNKHVVWDFLKLDGREQMALFFHVARARKSFPQAVVTGVR